MKLFLIFLLSIACLYSDAQTHQIDSLTREMKKAKGQSKIELFNALSYQYSFIAPDKSIDFAEKALALSKTLNDKQGQIKSYYNLGQTYMEMGENKTALLNLENGLGLSKKINDPTLTSMGLLHLGKYYGISGEPQKSIEHVNASLSLAKKNDLQKILFQGYNHLGITYQKLGNYNKSLEYYFQSLAIREALQDQRAISICFTNIGMVFQLSGKYDDAQNYFFKALDIDRKNNDDQGIMINLLNIGVVCQKKKAFTKALLYFNEAIEISRKLKFKKDEAVLLGNIGSTLRQQGQLNESLPYLLSALELQTGFNMEQSLAHTLNNLSETYLSLNKIDSSKSYAEKAIDLSAKSGELNQLRYGYQNLSDSYLKLGDYKNAYTFYGKSVNTKDSLFSIEKSRQIEELQITYETEKKEQEITSLSQQNKAAAFRRDSYAALAGLILIVGFLFYYNQRLKTKKNRQLLEKEQAVEKMQSRFFTNITHEFRTPLTLILAPIATMSEKISDPRLNQQLNIMKKNGRRLLTLVNQLLDLSKLESGNLKLNVAPGNIISIIKGVTMSFQSLAESKQIELLVNSEAREPILYFDQDKIEKVLSNLLSNAFKFTPPGGRIQVIVQAPAIAKNKDPKEWLQIIVKDTGKGIPADKVAHIFNRFYQVDDSLVREYEGSGIGLALTKEFIDLHHGSIEVFSQETKGTEMVLRLPMGKEHFIAAGIKVQDKIENSFLQEEENILPIISGNDDFNEGTSPDQQKPIVLLIEDNADVRQYIKEILMEDYTVIQAADGEAGVEKAGEQIPDLILSDVMMPKMNGYQVCKILKNAEKTSHIPIILLTAKASLESKLEGLQTAADDYLTKPFVSGELLARVHNLIQSRKKLREKFRGQIILKPSEIASSSIDDVFLNRLMKIVEENMGDELFGVERLSDEMGMSRSQLHRKLNALIGKGPNQLIRSFRLTRAHDLLKVNATTPAEIAYTVGFSSPSYFSKCFREQFGYTPSDIPGNSIS